MESTKVISCICSHEYQDKLYGKNLRLAVCGPKSATSMKRPWEGVRQRGWRCTVCRRTQPFNLKEEEALGRKVLPPKASKGSSAS